MKRVLLLAGAVITSAPAWAGVLYNQPAGFPGGLACACWTSSFGSDVGGGYQTFDNFQLTAGAGITAVDWQGLYWDFQNHGNNPVGPDTVTWTIEFRSDNAGTPGSPLYSQTLAAGSVTTNFVGVATDLGDATNVYAFNAVLPAVFTASANTTYWFSVLSNQPSFDPLFSWTIGSGGDGSSRQQLLGSFGSGFSTESGDRAFALESAPEPGTLGLFAAALPLLAFGLKRRR